MTEAPPPPQPQGACVQVEGLDLAGLNALFALIPPGPYDALHHTNGWEVRQLDTDPTNKHHWPYRLCESIAGQRAGCDEAVFSFIAGVLNAWPTISSALHQRDAARKALEWFVRYEPSIAADLLSAHRGRHEGVSQWMREDDKELRLDFGNACEAARQALSDLKETKDENNN